MSLLGRAEHIQGWIPVAASRVPEVDAHALGVIVTVAASMLKKGGAVHVLGQDLASAHRTLDGRLMEGRREAAEVRYALGLPMESTLGEVLEAIKRRSA